MSKLEERIAATEERLRKLTTQQQRVAARQRVRDSRQQRRDDTRRKILVGAIVLNKVEYGEIRRDQLMGWLDGALTRADDRALFELPGGSATS
jgi:hypothetical protein